MERGFWQHGCVATASHELTALVLSIQRTTVVKLLVSISDSSLRRVAGATGRKIDAGVEVFAHTCRYYQNDSGVGREHRSCPMLRDVPTEIF